MNPSMMGSRVVNTVFQLFGVIDCLTPNTCKVFVRVDAPGWFVVIVTGSKKSKVKAASMPLL
jgi:hypothetical protein